MKHLEIKLDEDFIFIVNFTKNSFANFAGKHKERERHLCQSWLNKLCGDEVFKGVDEKRKRNQYLIKLLTNVQNGALTNPFLNHPPRGKLDEIQLPQISNMAEPPWVKEFLDREAQQVNVGGKDFQYYVSTKLLDNNRGACAYLAISVADEGEVPKWLRLGSSKPFELEDFEVQIEDVYKEIMNQQPTDEDLYHFEDYIIKVIDDELSGQSSPGENYNLEKLLEQFEGYLMFRDERAIEKGRTFMLEILRQTITGVLQQQEMAKQREKEEQDELESLFSEIVE